MSKKLEQLIWGNPQGGRTLDLKRLMNESPSVERQNPRSAESYLSFLQPLIDLKFVAKSRALDGINEIIINKYTRQDMVESEIHLLRCDVAIGRLEGNLRQKYYVDEIEKLEKLIRKSWVKLFSNQEWSTFNRRQRLNDLYIRLHHFADMYARPRFKKLFLDSGISFATQPLEETLKMTEKLEEQLGVDESKYEEYSKLASPTKLYIDLGDDWAWFYIDSSRCEFEGEMAGHCGAERGAKLFSLRKKNKLGQWLPHVTASWFSLDGKTGFLQQIKGRSNSKPKAQYYPQIIKLLLSPEVLSIRKAGYKPESDFQFADLSPEIQKSILDIKPHINDFKGYIKTLDVEEIAKFYKNIAPYSYDVKVDGSKNFIQLFTADDPLELKMKLESLLSKRYYQILSDKIDSLDDPYNCYGEHINFKKMDHAEFLFTLQKYYPIDFERLELTLKLSGKYDENLSLTENLEKLGRNVDYEGNNSIADLTVQAEQDAYQQACQDAVYNDFLKAIGQLRFENSIANSGFAEGARIFVNKNGLPNLFIIALSKEVAIEGVLHGVEDLNDFFTFDYAPDRFLKSYDEIYSDYSALDVCERFVDLTR
jgi:hypothetical protein